MLVDHGVARVVADPARLPAASEPGGDRDVLYVRLHGSPEIYSSSYDGAFLDAIAARLRAHTGSQAWCVLDNTRWGHAIANALALRARIGAH